MKKSGFIFLLLLFFSSVVSAQYIRYLVKFKDKTGTPFSINNPSQFLSIRSVERRTKQHLTIDETDLPVVPRYIDSVRMAGKVILLDQSRWLNQACIETADPAALAKINNLPFVMNVQPLKRLVHQPLISKNKFPERTSNVHSAKSPPTGPQLYSYGYSYGQIHIHEGEYLHDKGFRGEGMQVAIIDAGFFHFQTLPAFDSARLNNQIIETYDFVDNETSVNEDNPHGMECFSIIAGNIPGQLVGSSPKANFFLYRTEDASSEYPVEEQYWAVAAERADSMGADVISTSLGYNLFDDPVFNYAYADMNGHTSIVAKAATLAARKGMIVVAAAGNEAGNSWHFITTPGDADSILTVGAIDTSGAVGTFSSYGPSADGRVKPTVASVGVSTAISSPDGAVVTGNGTSFATPNMAGLVTCLWQAFPELSNMEIIEAVKRSSSSYNTPNDEIGYGIPNFRIAFENLTNERILRNSNTFGGNNSIFIYPNPFRDHFTVLIKPDNTAMGTFKLYDMAGRLHFSQLISLQSGQARAIQFNNLPPLPRGIYILRFSDEKSIQSFKVVLQ